MYHARVCIEYARASVVMATGVRAARCKVRGLGIDPKRATQQLSLTTTPSNPSHDITLLLPRFRTVRIETRKSWPFAGIVKSRVARIGNDLFRGRQ